MKKSLLLMIAAMAAGQAKADEGMWTLFDLPQPVYQQMKSYGFDAPYDDIYRSDNAIKNSVINFCGYCSGVVVSADGLVFTNHHCGFEAIRSHSTVEHDYMLNGFYAKTFEEELPNRDMFVSFMVEQKDVTDDLRKAGIESVAPSKLSAYLDSIETAWTKDVKAKDSTLRLEVKPFYEGNRFYATTYRDFTDVRLVFTVPKSMGKYGGETDNWMWPRQTCDFAVFRIYADPKTNGPADYSKDNVPYKPASWAKVSMNGYKDGDYAMTMGYPGSTERYLSSFGIRERRDADNAPRAQVRGVKQDVMIKHMRADEAVRIKYDSKYAQSSNYWKNSIGMNKCIDSIGLIAQKEKFEAQIKAYQDKTGYLKGKLDFDKMKELYGKRLVVSKAYRYFAETFMRTNELVTRAMQVHNGKEVMGKEGKKSGHYITFKDNSDEWDESLDKDVLAALLRNYRDKVDAKYLPEFYKTIDSNFGGDYTKYVDFVWANTVLMKNDEKIYINKKEFKEDLAVKMGEDLTKIYNELAQPLKELRDEIALQERYLCDAKVRMEQDMPHYSDANFTMRLSYGKVGEFMLDGKPSGYYTDAESLVKKMKEGEKFVDYYAEPIMHELLSAKDFGRYTDKTTGKMQLCFLTGNDITGGNSGSPVFDKHGDLIGLAFDGNWDSLANDIFFDSRLGRTICVDVRYMLFLMDKWGHADRLLKEMNVK